MSRFLSVLCNLLFGNGNALNDPVCWVFDDQDGDVNTRGQPAPLNLVSFKVMQKLALN
jgi:hypothetical protein